MSWWKRTPADAAPKPAGHKVSDGSLQAHLGQLATADTVAFGGVGVAATLLPVTTAYLALREVLPRRGEELRPGLGRLLDTATPAGRVYAAELLSLIDETAGQAAWRRLAGESGEVSTFVGCIMGRTTLGRYATDRLSA